MKTLVLLVCVTLVACLGAEAASTQTQRATRTTRAPPPASKCGRCDSAPYDPVCVKMGGTDKEPKLTTFGSECVLKSYNCEKGLSLAVQKKGECPPGSPVRLQ